MKDWVEKFNEERKELAGKQKLTEKQKKILKDIRESPRPPPAEVRKKTKRKLKNLGGIQG